MKILLFIIAAFLFIQTTNSQDWVEFSASETTETNCNVLTSADSIVEFEINVPGLFSSIIDTFSRVQIKNHTRLDSVGYPEIPIISYLVAIPDCDNVLVNVELLDSIKMSNFNIYPAPEMVTDTIEGGVIALVEEFAYNQSFYELDTWFPGKVVEAVDKGAIRAQDVVRILFYPISFNPAKKEIWAYSKAKVSLAFFNFSGSIQRNVGIFNEVIDNTLINYNSNGLNASVSCGAGLGNTGSWKWATNFPNDAIMDTCDYLLLTNEVFFNEQAAKVYIDSLARHRAEFNGFDIIMVKMDDIEDSISGLNDTERMRNLIKNTFNLGFASNTYDGKLAYVNLFGDLYDDFGNILVQSYPFENPPISYSSGYDVYFTQLTQEGGTYDPYPDLMIGRCSVDNTEQVQNVVHKILHFKPDTLQWKDNMLTVVGENTVFETVEDVLFDVDAMCDNNYQYALSLPFDYNCSIPDWDTISHCLDSVQKAYKQGVMFYNYMGHGGSGGWGGSPISSYSCIPDLPLYNLPFFLSASCLTGAFQSTQNEDCIGEQMLCADSAKGSIGFFGASVVVSGSSFHFINDYYKSLINNSCAILGEAITEIRINGFAKEHIYTKKYNLLGDPAVNVLYENIDTLRPDIVIKNTNIKVDTLPLSVGHTAVISVCVKNLYKEVNSPFDVIAFAGHPDSIGSFSIDTATISYLSANSRDTVLLYWDTYGIAQGFYDIFVFADKDNAITELDESNNISNKNITLYRYKNGFPIEFNTDYCSYPLTFDFDNSNLGPEILYGGNILTSQGEVLSYFSSDTRQHLSIGDFSNNGNFSMLIRQKGDTLDYIKSVSDSILWSYSIPTASKGSQIIDFDNDGYEEVINAEVDVTYIQQHGVEVPVSINAFSKYDHEGQMKWKYFIDTVNNESTTKTPVAAVFDTDGYPGICILSDTGVINIYKEYSADSAYLYNSKAIENCVKIWPGPPVASDIDKDGLCEIVMGYEVAGADTSDMVSVFKGDSLDVDHSFTLPPSYYISPIISDINNDGIAEIIVGQPNQGIWIFNHELDSIGFIGVESLKSTINASGDLDGDDCNDIIVTIIDSDNRSMLLAYNHNHNLIYSTPITSYNMNVWLDDVDQDGSVDIIGGIHNDLFLFDVPDAGTSIGWPGQHGNTRNTGVLLQPAYMPPTDTVYWYNTLLVTDSLVVDSSQTLVVKPGTTIKCDAGSQVNIYGRLIAEGTANHPITFTADTMNANNNYWQGITFANGSTSSLKYVEISNAEFGILYEDFGSQTLEHCTFTNNQVGVGAFNASPEIYRCTFTGNGKGIGSYSNGSPVLTDLYGDEEYKNAIVDNDTCIYVASGSIYLDEGYNDIYNDPASGYYLYSNSTARIQAAYNYWGTADARTVQAYLYPAARIVIDPVCTTENTNFKSTTPEKSLFKNAWNDFYNGQTSQALAGFMQVIGEYPLTNEAYLSIPAIYNCYKSAGLDMANLESIFTTMHTDTTAVIDKGLVYGYLNLCKRDLGKYSEAITNYESIILNNPSYNDSVFAVINIGNTYREAGSYKASLGTLAFLRPQSDAAHIQKTIDLLKTLHPENEHQVIFADAGNSMFELFPNPASESFTLRFIAKKDENINIQLRSVNGEVVRRMVNLKAIEGQNDLDINTDGLPTGVYYVSVSFGNLTMAVEKIVIVKQ